MGKGYLLDTNAVLDYMGGRMTGEASTALARIIDRQINLSVINKIELLGFSKVEQDIVDFVGYADIYPMDEPVVDKTIEIRRIHSASKKIAIFRRFRQTTTIILIVDTGANCEIALPRFD